MTPEQALNILAQATEPNVRLTRADYVLINQALGVLEELIKNQLQVQEKVVGGS
jgi:hypothetical protein